MTKEEMLVQQMDGIIRVAIIAAVLILVYRTAKKYKA